MNEVNKTTEYPVTIIVLGYNNKEKLIECLHSLEQTDYPNFKIVLADNNSTDGSVEFVQENFHDVEIIKFQRNYGFIAYNYVVDNIEDEYITLINNDIVVTKDWLKNLMPYIIEHLKWPLLKCP